MLGDLPAKLSRRWCIVSMFSLHPSWQWNLRILLHGKQAATEEDLGDEVSEEGVVVSVLVFSVV
jgi:hypothetical protein